MTRNVWRKVCARNERQQLWLLVEAGHRKRWGLSISREMTLLRLALPRGCVLWIMFRYLRKREHGVVIGSRLARYPKGSS